MWTGHHNEMEHGGAEGMPESLLVAKRRRRRNWALYARTHALLL